MPSRARTRSEGAAQEGVLPMQQEATPTYPTLRARSGVLVVDGYGICIRVHRGRLTISDGIGRERRERTIARSSRDVRRLVLLGHAGYVTLEAIRWMSDVGIGFCHIDTDGRLIASSVSLGNDDARLRRAQALAPMNLTGVEVARFLIASKLEGEARNLRKLPGADAAAEEITAMREALDRARSLGEIRRVEVSAALAYWRSWEGVEIRFAKADFSRLPADWHTFGQRGSPLAGGPRSSVCPINSLLNYLFALLEAECTIACLAVGLDPGLGIVHADLRARASFALDLMEAVRPEVESWVLDLLSTRTFRSKDFHETRQGVCRMLAPLTHVLAATLPLWREAVAPIAEEVVRILARDAGIAKVPTHLTQDRRSAGRDGSRKGERRSMSRAVRLARACERCGSLVEDQRKLCDVCFASWREELEARLVTVGPEALARLRASGDDPVRRPEVRKRIGGHTGRRNAEIAAWEREHGAGQSAEYFTAVVLPQIVHTRTSVLAHETGLSVNYCATIKAGKHIPHARHWESLLRAAHQ